MMITIKQAEKLVKIARTAILNYFRKKVVEIKEFPEKQGVFVTLHSYPDKELRGCIGFPYAVTPLGKAVSEASVEAAFSDPRFRQLERSELNKVIIEISVLTEPKLIKAAPEKIPEQISIGKDGLICRCGHFTGLLLPQVALEHKMNAAEFLNAVCMKANLPQDAWKKPECKIYKFQAQIFSEKTPAGEVEERIGK